MAMTTQGQYLSQITTRVTQARTTARSRIDQARARVTSMGIGGGGLLKNVMPKGLGLGTVPIKTFARPRVLDRFRQTKAGPNANAMVGMPRTPANAPTMTYDRPMPNSSGTPPGVKSYSKASLRAIKTF